MSPYSVAALRPLALRPYGRGGDEGIRTLDPLRARQVLSQLSYTPIRLLGLLILLPFSRLRKCSHSLRYGLHPLN